VKHFAVHVLVKLPTDAGLKASICYGLCELMDLCAAVEICIL